MTDGQNLTEEKLIRAFNRLGEYIARSRKRAVIFVYGGAAIKLTVDRARTTNDVDAVVQGAEHGDVMRAAHKVAEEIGLPRGWLSEGVSSYTSTVDRLKTSEVHWYGDFPRWGGTTWPRGQGRLGELSAGHEDRIRPDTG